MDEQTKIIYHITDEETPYLITIPVNPEEVTLGDFTNVINKPGYRFFFKHMDEDIGVVKEEISDEKCKLPCYQGRVVSWLVPIEGAKIEKVRRSNSQETGSDGSGSSGGGPRGGPPLPRRNGRFNGDSDTSSIISDVSSVMSSEIDTTSVADSDEEKSARNDKQRPRRRRRRRAPKAPVRCSSYSSMTESSSSLNIINVTLDMETINFLGISILGSSDKDGGGIYVGKILKGGAVEADGRISTNDYILSVNDISFENMSNDEAVENLKKILQKPGPIKLVIAKTNWDGNNYMDDLNQADYTDADTVSLASTTLDPTAQWIQQQQGNIQGYFHNYYNQGGQSMYSVPSTGSESPSNSQIGMDTMRGYTHASLPLSLNASMAEIVKAMSAPASDLDVKERTWLKVTIPDAFIGLDVVNWLYKNVRGFSERKEARKYACNLLKEGYIKHTVNKDRFSEQCYYVFGEVNNVNNVRQQMKNVNLNADPSQVALSQRSDPSQRSYRSVPNWQQQVNKPPGSVMSRGSGETASSGSELSAPRGLVGARPGPPGSVLSQKGPGLLTPSTPSIPYNQTAQYHQTISSYAQPPMYQPAPGSVYSSQAPGSGYQSQPPYNQLSAKDRAGSISSLGSAYSYSSSVSGMSGRPLGAMPASVAGSSQSFRLAVDNPLEYFSDAV